MKPTLDTLDTLEQRVADLIGLVETIHRDHEILQQDHRMLRQEFQSLQEKNKMARRRIEQMVSRLESLSPDLSVDSGP